MITHGHQDHWTWRPGQRPGFRSTLTGTRIGSSQRPISGQEVCRFLWLGASRTGPSSWVPSRSPPSWPITRPTAPVRFRLRLVIADSSTRRKERVRAAALARLGSPRPPRTCPGSPRGAVPRQRSRRRPCRFPLYRLLSGIDEQGYRRGKAVEEVLPADRSDLPRAVEACQRKAPEHLGNERCVVIRNREQA